MIEIVCSVEMDAKKLVSWLDRLTKNANEWQFPTETSYFVLHTAVQIPTYNENIYRLEMGTYWVPPGKSDYAAAGYAALPVRLDIADLDGIAEMTIRCDELFAVYPVSVLEQMNQIRPVHITSPTIDALRGSGEVWAVRLLALVGESTKSERDEQPSPENDELPIPGGMKRYSPADWDNIFRATTGPGRRPDYADIARLTGKSWRYVQKRFNEWVTAKGDETTP